jgi:Transposase DDE domain group 1
MPNCTEETGTRKIEFGCLGRRIVQGQFDGGSMTSDVGVMLLVATDRKLGLMQAAARCIADPRSPLLIKHGVANMLQSMYALALGWEDLNDHGALRCDMAMQTTVGVDTEVTSAPRLCPLEEWADQVTAWRLHEVLVDCARRTRAGLRCQRQPAAWPAGGTFLVWLLRLLLLFAAIRVLRPVTAVRLPAPQSH